MLKIESLTVQCIYELRGTRDIRNTNPINKKQTCGKKIKHCEMAFF